MNFMVPVILKDVSIVKKIIHQCLAKSDDSKEK